jgi:hypothetical protein
MRGARNGRRWLSWLGIIAVLSNVLAGALCHMPAQARAAAGPIDDALGPLAICTAHGEQAPATSGSEDPDGKLSHCAACTLLAGFALAVVLAFTAVAFPPTFIFYRLRPGARTLADHLSLGGIRSRAPPVPA